MLFLRGQCVCLLWDNQIIRSDEVCEPDTIVREIELVAIIMHLPRIDTQHDGRAMSLPHPDCRLLVGRQVDMQPCALVDTILED